ncbi:MAG: polysaccharide biosynthesis tyrosine autokinase [Bacteroidota bacterium]|jgi:tyrosine-protein kinase Etk/Wzc
MNSSQDNLLIDTGNKQSRDVPREAHLREYIAILFRGRWIILFTLFTFIGIVAFFTFKTKPVYEASSLVLIDMKGKEGSLPIFDITGAATTNKITNELEILKSNATAVAVAHALLSQKYFDDSKSAVMPIIIAEGNTAPGDSLATESMVVIRLVSSVQFAPVRESDIIRITARSTDPKEAALIANVYSEIYATRNLNMSRLRSQAVREFLQTQLQSKRTVLDTAENDLQSYMKLTGIVSLDVEVNKIVEQFSQLEAQRDGMEVEKSSRLKTLDSYKEELARQEPNAAKAISESNDSYIRLLQEQLAKLEVQRDVVIAQNPSMIDEKIYSEKLGEINSQITSLKKRLNERTETFLNSLLPGGHDLASGNAPFLAQVKQKIIEQQIELGGLDARIKALNTVIVEYEKKFNQIPHKSIELAKLQRARLSSEKLYLLIEEKYNEAAIKEKSEFGYVNIIDPAIVPVSPVSPRVGLNLVLSFLIGLGFGIGIVFMREFVDLRIRTPEDLKRYGFTLLSMISLMNDEVKKIKLDITTSNESHIFDPHLVSYYRRLSPVAESYRHLRANVQYVQVDTPLRCIVITSVNPEEGKTTTIANLAISFSQADKKVLLIDADMRRSKIHTVFGLKNSVGLTEHLFGRASADEVIQKDVLPNLDIITCGIIPPNPSEILGSTKMKEFIVEMKQRYNIILCDSPPLLVVTDAAVLATETDGVLLVASAGSTRANGLEQVMEFLSTINVKILGVVLNNFDMAEAYGGYYSSYHYGYYGYESGYYHKDVEEESKKSFLDRFIRQKRRG